MQSHDESNASGKHFEQAIENYIEALDQLEEALDQRDKISLQTSSNEISDEDILDNTVDDLKTLIQNQEFPSSELKKALEIEKKGKDRKTAKKAIRKDLKRKRSSNLRKNIINNAQELQNILTNIKSYNGYEESTNSEDETEIIHDKKGTEITRKTEDILSHLREGSLDAKEIEKVKQAVEDYNQEDFISMNQRLEEIELSKGSATEDFDTQKEISKMESMLRSLEKKEKKIDKNKPASLDDLKSKVSDIETDQKKRSRIRRLEKGGFEPEKLENLTDSELRDLESSEESVDEIEDIFTKIDDTKSRLRTQGESDGGIDDNIQKLERIIN